MEYAFAGNGQDIPRVFAHESLRAAGLTSEPVLTNRQDFYDAPERCLNTRYLFATWGMPPLDEGEIRRFLPELRAVFYAAGSVQYFARPFFDCGVRIFSAWQANAVPVAEYTTAQIILANKGFFRAARLYGKGDFSAAKAVKYSISGNYDGKVGIIGAGMIGKKVIGLLKNYALSPMVFDPFLPDETAEALGAVKVPLETLFSECGVVSNHLANNPQTVNMLTYELFARMPQNGVFLNTGRGAQVSETGLARALAERADLSAVLDVTIDEPLPAGHPFFRLPNLFLTPHIAGSLGRECRRMGEYMLHAYRCYRRGEPVPYEVTPDMLATMA